MNEHEDRERVEIRSDAELWDWLDEHHDRPDGVLLVTFKKSTPDAYVSREHVLDALVAYGWVDGRRFKVDDDRTMQLISPRRQQRLASSYIERASRLEAEGRMRPPGRNALEAARQSGLADELRHVDQLLVPDDLRHALQTASAWDWWTDSAPSYRRNVLRWVANAKKAPTRTRRIDTITSHAARGEKVPNY